MYTGWVLRFKHGTHIDLERYDQLKQKNRHTSSDNLANLIRFNSTFIEIIDRRFRQRGMVATLFGTAGFVFLVYWGIDFGRISFVPNASGEHDFVALPFAILAFGGCAAWLWWWFLSKEFFTHTHYPIRFNRKTRMVYAYRDKRDGGIVSVPWDKAFFHIGKAGGEGTEYLRDIRCYVVDDSEKILDTFAVGHYFDDSNKVHSVFEFIRRYMEEGPENVFEDPSAKAAKAGLETPPPLRRIDLSVVPSLRNCFNWVVMAMPARWVSARYFLMPLYAPLFLTRWLVFKTCKTPKWPEKIEAESLIEPNDPYRLEEPTVHVQWGDN